MNWIEYTINEVREKKLPKLELIAEFNPARKKYPIALPPEVFQLKHLRSLTLENLTLTKIPEGIGELTMLEELRLAFLSDFKLPHTLGRLKKLKTLKLFSLDLSEIPFDLASLEELEELTLYSSMLEFVPRSLASLKKLASLNLRAKKLDGVYEILEELPALKRVTLNFEKTTLEFARRLIELLGRRELIELELADLPHAWLVERLSEMPSLEVVRLSGKGVGKFPIQLARLPRLRTLSLRSQGDVGIPDAIVEFAGLQRLSLSSNYFSADAKADPAKVSKNLLELPRLQSLSLTQRNIAHIFPSVFELGSLEELSLVNCGIAELPGSFEALRLLKSLNLSSNDLPGLPAGLFGLPKLEDLWLHGTEIRTMPSEIANLSKNLRNLSVGDCKLSALPEGICQLANLQGLYAANNSLKELPKEIDLLRELEVLDLERNQLSEFPIKVASLPKLRVLNVQDNPIISPPPEILAQGALGIQNYYSALIGMPAERLYEAKLLIVGEGAVGKTSLAKKLMEPACDLEKPQEGIHSTEGIEIRTWEVSTQQTARFRVNLWDFGGQEIYHATHQFFLTKRSLYLFVWDARKEDRMGGFDYWLNVVRLLSAGSPVIVVLNKSDERVREIDEADLKNHFPSVLEFHKVSALRGTGIDELRSRIKVNLAALPHVGDEWPLKWSKVRRTLEDDSRDYMSREEYLQVCKAESLPASQSGSLASYLHDLGVVLHFQDDPVLRQIVILKPDWGTNAVYRVLDTRKVQDAKGRFTMADLAEIWDDDKYPTNRHVELLHLMIKFELCFPLGSTGVYVAPELLSAEPPQLDWESSNNLVFEYHYQFMPAGIITRFIGRLYTAIEGEKYWRNGVVLASRGARALMVGEPLNRRIRISISGANRRELLSVIRHHIDEIHRTLNEPEVTEMVPCNCKKCRQGNPHLFAYPTLESYISNRIEEIRCEKSLENVPIRELLAEVFEPRAKNESLAEGRSIYTIGTVERLYIGTELAMPSSKSTSPSVNNPWVAGSFYLFAIVVVIALLAAAGKVLSPWWLPVLILGGLLVITVVGALQLRNDERLKENNFLKLMAMAFRQIPLLGRLAGAPPKATDEEK